MITRIWVGLDTRKIRETYKGKEYVEISTYSQKIFIFHYPQDIEKFRTNLERADVVICCFPKKFADDHPEYAHKVIGGWDKVSMVHFEKDQLIIRPKFERIDKMATKFVVIKIGSDVEVIGENEYKQRQNIPSHAKIIFFYNGDDLRFPKEGKFSSFFPVFTEEKHFMKVSFSGDLTDKVYPVNMRSAMIRAKRSFEDSGLDFETFIRALDRLHKNKEI